jgi:hypothetical protein
VPNATLIAVPPAIVIISSPVSVEGCKITVTASSAPPTLMVY